MPETDTTVHIPIRVLLVDDHHMVAESLRRAIEREPGLDVVGTVGSAAAAFQAVADWRPDVVVMDLLLPDMDGIEATRRLCAEDSTTRVLMLTGSANERSMQDAIEAGCIGYLQKDAVLPELMTAIRRAHRGELVLSPDDLKLILANRPDHQQSDDTLTRRETEVLELLADGMSNKKIADHLTISIDTTRTHVQRILAKLDSHSRLEAVAEARRRKLLK
jgi:two-component system, NarL family, nitrate/nitrite response regulator NarL